MTQFRNILKKLSVSSLEIFFESKKNTFLRSKIIDFLVTEFIFN
tara:strand:- start:9 stop:140 length:132 start_codon:yes stop_codon:yes gene_type:complete